jgi:hypothetical protein
MLGSNVNDIKPIPSSLIDFLSDASILKVGVGVRADVKAVRTRNPSFTDNQSFFNLEDPYKKCFPKLRRLGLRNLSASVLCLNLSKSAQMSDWDRTMSQKMVLYAANDAIVGIVLFHGLVGTIQLLQGCHTKYGTRQMMTTSNGSTSYNNYNNHNNNNHSSSSSSSYRSRVPQQHHLVGGQAGVNNVHSGSNRSQHHHHHRHGSSSTSSSLLPSGVSREVYKAPCCDAAYLNRMCSGKKHGLVPCGVSLNSKQQEMAHFKKVDFANDHQQKRKTASSNEKKKQQGQQGNNHHHHPPKKSGGGNSNHHHHSGNNSSRQNKGSIGRGSRGGTGGTGGRGGGGGSTYGSTCGLRTNERKTVKADASSAVHLSASSQPNKRKMVVQAARDDASVNDIEKIFGSLSRDEKKKKK